MKIKANTQFSNMYTETKKNVKLFFLQMSKPWNIKYCDGIYNVYKTK